MLAAKARGYESRHVAAAAAATAKSAVVMKRFSIDLERQDRQEARQEPNQLPTLNVSLFLFLSLFLSLSFSSWSMLEAGGERGRWKKYAGLNTAGHDRCVRYSLRKRKGEGGQIGQCRRRSR